MSGLKLVLALSCLCCLPLAVCRADDTTKHGFLDQVIKAPDGTEAKYVLFVPHDYKGDKAYPVIVFLHGSGETGTDGQKQAQVGLGPAIKKHEKDFGFIAVFPQSQERTWKADSADAQRALNILAE